MELFSYILSQFAHYWYVERLPIVFKLILYLVTLLKLFMVSRGF
jgi:hypothetical protein